MRRLLTATAMTPLSLLSSIPPATGTGHSLRTPKLFKRDTKCYQDEVVCGTGCMPNTASCCSSGYCVAGKYCDEDGCCPNGRKCAAPTTLISLAPESKTSTSTSPATTVSDPAASSSAIVEPPKHTEAGNSLSTGAKAGIGVGAGIGGLAILIGIAFLVVMARKRKQAKRADGGQLQPPENPPVTPMIPPEMSPSPLKQELDSKNIPAIVRPKSDATLVSSLSPVSPNQTNNVVYELDGTTGPRSELVGSPEASTDIFRASPSIRHSSDIQATPVGRL